MLLPLAVLCALVLAAGGYLAYRFKGAPSDRVADVVPGEATTYLNIFVQPSTSQAKHLGHLVADLVDTDAGEEIRDGLQDFVDPCGGDLELLRSLGASQVALFVMPDGSIACASDVSLPSEERLDSEAVADVRGVLVFGQRAAVAAARSGLTTESLASLGEYRDAIGDAEPDRLAFVLRNGAIYRSTEGSEILRDADSVFSSVEHAVVRVEEGRLVVEGLVGTDGAELWQDRPAPEAGGAPQGAWLVMSVRNLSGWLDALANHGRRIGGDPVVPDTIGSNSEELWGWTDASRLWVGGSGFSVAAGIEAVADSESVARRVEEETLPELATAPASPFLRGVFSSLVYERDGEVISAQLGPRLKGTIGDDPRFQEAEAWLDQPETSLYLDLAAAEPWISLLHLTDGQRELVSHLDRLIIGGGEGGDNFTWRAVIGVREEE